MNNIANLAWYGAQSRYDQAGRWKLPTSSVKAHTPDGNQTARSALSLYLLVIAARRHELALAPTPFRAPYYPGHSRAAKGER